MGNQCCKPDEKNKQSGFVPLGNQVPSLTSSPNSSTILTSGTNSTPIVTNASIQIQNSSSTGLIPPNGVVVSGGLLNGGNGNIQSIKDMQAEEEAAAEREERQLALQQEQNRLEEIVALAGRDMVPVVVRNGGSMNSLNSIGGYTGGSGGSGGGGGGNNIHAFSLGGYYDPGYANLIMQDLSHALMEYNQSINNEKQGVGATAGGGVNDDNKAENAHRVDTTNDIFQNCRSIPETCVIDGRDAIDVLCNNNSSSRRRIEKDYDLDLEDMAETFLTSVFCTKGGLVKDIGPIVENVFSAGD